MTAQGGSLYDTDDYYLPNDRGSRLSPVFGGLLFLLDWIRARQMSSMLHPGPSRVLDVGAGDGTFLHLMRRRGVRPTGTTTSKRSARAAERLYGITLELSTGLEEVQRAAPFDLVTYWHVFEHLEDPRRHSEQWARLLAPRGLLVIEVPNIDSIGATLCHRSWLGSDPVHHVNQQTCRSLCDRLRESGLIPERIDHFSLKFSYLFAWSALLGALFGRRYDFDFIMDVLKRPAAMLTARRWSMLNTVASLVYLAPVVLMLIVVGLASGRGEVVRVYARPQA